MVNEILFENFSDGSIVSGEWEGTGVFDELIKVINGNVKVQFDAGRIKGSDYANVYIAGITTAITEGMKYILSKQQIEKQLNLLDKQVEAQDVQVAIQEVQLAENSEKWAIQKKVLDNQLAMSDIDVQYKEPNVLKDLELKDKQIEASYASIAFDESKRLIMEQTRKDNIRSKAAEQFAEFIKYLSAANVVPGAQDFINMRALINAMNTGIANPDNAAVIIDTTGTIDTTKDYVVPTKAS